MAMTELNCSPSPSSLAIASSGLGNGNGVQHNLGSSWHWVVTDQRTTGPTPHGFAVTPTISDTQTDNLSE